MQHIKSFNEYLLVEKKTFSPANIKMYNFDKNSVNNLKKWSFKIKDIEFKFNDFEYFGNNSDFIKFLNGEDKSMYDLFTVIANNSTIYKVKFKTGESKLNFDMYSEYISFNADSATFAKFITSTPNKIEGFINFLNFLFGEFSDEIYSAVNDSLNLKTLYVIRAGKISPSTGKTDHGWSIYDNPDAMLGVANNGIILYTANGMEVGDKFKLLDDQTHKVIFKEVEIKELVPATYKDFVNLSKRKGANIPVGAYQKQPGTFQFTLYSIK